MNGRGVIRATIDDAVPHIYSREQADAIIAKYPKHEQDARSKGIPTLGSGRIFPIADDAISFDASKQAFPDHWVWGGGIDFGWDHPTAAVKCCWDREGAFYVTNAYRRSEQTPVVHAGALRLWGDWLPWAWPHDGNNDTAAGKNLSTQYREQGLKMMQEKACFPDGGNSVEAGLMEMLDAMQAGMFFVASHLNDWFEEFRLYHRDKGKVVKEFDDLMSATRYAWMMRRYFKRAGGQQPGDFERGIRSSAGWMR